MNYEKRETDYRSKEQAKIEAQKNCDYVSLSRLKRKFETPQRFISSFLSNRGLEGKLVEYQFVNHWKEIVGEGIANNATPKFLKNNILYLEVSSPIWVQELSFQKTEILNRLNEYFCAQQGIMQRVRDLKFAIK